MNFQAKLHPWRYGDSFSGYKAVSKVWLLALEVKLQQASYD